MEKIITEETEDDMIFVKEICASCGHRFKNNYKKYKARGNYCDDCMIKIHHKEKWRVKAKNAKSRK